MKVLKIIVAESNNGKLFDDGWLARSHHFLTPKFYSLTNRNFYMVLQHDC